MSDRLFLCPIVYFEDSFTQSAWARVFTVSQSLDATSQLTMVRLDCATWPLATVEVAIESWIYTPATSNNAPKIIPRNVCMSNPPVPGNNALRGGWFPEFADRLDD
jgi:hypothetical protein